MNAYFEAEQLTLPIGPVETRPPLCEMKPVNIRDISVGLNDDQVIHDLPAYIYQKTGRTIVQYFVQEKFNGIGFRARARTGGIELWTTRAKYWPASFFPPVIYNGLAQMLVTLPPEAILYGEFVTEARDTKLATLGGQCSVNAERFTGDPANLRALVYDYWPNNGKLFQYRTEDLKKFRLWGHPNVRATSTYHTESVLEIKRFYNDIVADDGEGVIIRVDPCLLDPQSDGTRHPLIIKWKRRHDAEGICVGVCPGEGKRTGMLGSLILRAKLDGQTENTFSVGGGIGMTDELLTKLWKNPPVGKLVTFTYEELSINGTPLRPQFVAVRDYEA